MSRLEIILSAFLILSVIINVGLVVYVRAAIARLLLVSEELGDLQDMINSFLDHTKNVYEMEMFYGDQTLQSLLQHARDFSSQMESFEFIYSLTDEEEAPAITEEEFIENDN
tara:strand:- start:14577 stop:14912 length:336 start_codon:yes stop_codon:yes gene_type:complete